MPREREPLDAHRWSALMAQLGFAANLDTFQRLQAAYAEKHRHYHTAEHINQCLAKLDEVRHLAQRPAEVELALWFHDAAYATRSKRNEAKSAAWATTFLVENGADEGAIERVRDAIMATQHKAPAERPDAGLVVDIDLSILGADEETYATFERNVRKEYAWVPGPLFKKTRAAILRSFLGRPSIYVTAAFRADEPVARRNLAAAIAALEDRA